MNTFVLVALNSQYVHTNLAVRLIKNLDRYNNVCVLEHTINNHMDAVLEDIISKSPKCIIFSCYIWNISYVGSLIRNIKKILPETVIALAGPEVSYNPGSILDENPAADIICTGEGEIVFPQLQDGIINNNLDDVEGICFRHGKNVVCNPVISEYNINNQKFPYYDIEDVKDRILYYETSRGCPFKCSYCISGISNSVRLMDIEKVRESFEIFFKHNVKQVKLVDRTFNYPNKRAVSIIKIMLELKSKYPDSQTSFHCELNPLLINKEFAETVSTAPKGFIQFEIGIQSTNPETLKTINREVNMDKQFDNITMLTNIKNAKVYVDLIAGLPYETYEIFKKSFNDIYSLDADCIHLGFLKILKGSYMEKTSKLHGIKYQDNAPYKILKSDYITYNQLCHLEKIEKLIDTYNNSENFSHSVKYGVSCFSSPYSFYDEFCTFLKRNDYFNRPHKFTYYYDILYEFLSAERFIDTEYLRSLILHDYAGNSKPRIYPNCINSAYSEIRKNAVREFFNNSDNIQKYLPEYSGLSPSTVSRQCNLEIFDYDVTSDNIIKTKTIIVYDYLNEHSIHKIK